MDIGALGQLIVDTAYHLHRGLGPGLVESVYSRVYARELARRGLFVERNKKISFEYEGLWFENAFCADLIVENLVIIEVKSVTALAPVHYSQLLTYLRLLDLPVGYLINFGSPLFKAGVKKVVNGYVS